MKIACLFHADQDGFGAAFALWKALKDTDELLFIEVQYGQEPPYEALRTFGPDQVYIVDFSYKADVLKPFLDEFDIFIIDHHVTSLPELEATFCDPLRVYETYIHDVNLSGCVLTWQHFFPEEEIPDILLYVQDRDLWKFELENSKEINAFIASLPKDFEEWDQFYTPEAYDAGRAIIRLQDKAIERRLKDVCCVYFDASAISMGDLRVTFRRRDYSGTLPVIPCVNASENISELGAAMCEAYPDAPFSMSYCDRVDEVRTFSLRSVGDFDVSEIAKRFGGGGHKNAAAFQTAAPEVI